MAIRSGNGGIKPEKKYFIVYTLPRSGSAWVANFLTIPGYSFCAHDPLCNFSSVRDLKAWLDSRPEKHVGICDTLAFRVFANLRTVFPTAKTAALVRPVRDINESLKKQNTSAIIADEWVLFEQASRYVDHSCSFSELFNYWSNARINLHTNLLPTVPWSEDREHMLLDLKIERKANSYREQSWRSIARLLNEKIENVPTSKQQELELASAKAQYRRA